MMNCIRNNLSGFLLLCVFIQPALAAPTVGETAILGPFVGLGAPLHPDNISPHKILFYGTDLGWTYEHQGKLHIIFGDTNSTPEITYIEESTGKKYDDGFGVIDLEKWIDPDLIQPDRIPLVKLGQNKGTNEMSAINAGPAMEGFKTPVGAFSNGTDQYGIFYFGKPQPCQKDSDCDNGLSCDNGLGYYLSSPYVDEEYTLACIDGTPFCNSDPMQNDDGSIVAGSGMCVDKTSSAWAESNIGRISAAGLKNLIGIRSTADPRKYTHTKAWYTNKFSNPAVRTVESFVPDDLTKMDYGVASGTDGNQRVFIWGRPGFVGVKATGRDLGLYFAYVDMPKGQDFSWDVNYYTGTNDKGMPQFSTNEKEAVALDLNSITPGNQPEEIYDITDQMSVAWVEHLNKWVMFYGGGFSDVPRELLLNCGVLEFFTRDECKQAEIGNGAFRMRSADHPWGPWTPPQDIIIGGDPNVTPLEHQYAEGGVLFHKGCVGDKCVPSITDRAAGMNDYGFFYSANIIEQWIKPAGDAVDIIWNASTWNPYRIILLRTRINP